MTLGDRRFYTIQVAEKGIAWTKVRTTGTPGHGSMPHPDNAAVKLAAAVTALAADQDRRAARLIPVVDHFLRTLGLGEVAALAESDFGAASAALDASVSDPVLRRSILAMLRDTATPTVVHAGKKVNVMPGSGEAEIRTLPGTDQAAFVAHLQDVVGKHATVEPVITLPPVEWPDDAEIVGRMTEALRTADPDGIPVPMMITPGTDAKALMDLGIPCYGFAPLRLEADMPFLSLFHGHDERVPVSALGFGLPVLADVVSRYAARDA
jgi:acetylornithine deacetylase/succinyl-diaminopimelate desuccinylase-like protein